MIVNVSTKTLLSSLLLNSQGLEQWLAYIRHSVQFCGRKVVKKEGWGGNGTPLFLYSPLTEV